MEEVYSALLLHSIGQPVSEENIRKILEAAGAKIDEGKIKALVASLEGKNIDELIEQAATMVAPKKEEEKVEKKEEKEEKKEEEAAAGLSALFG